MKQLMLTSKGHKNSFNKISNIILIISVVSFAYLDEPLANLTKHVFDSFAIGILISLFFKKHLIIFIVLIIVLNLFDEWIISIFKNRKHRILTLVYLVFLLSVMVFFSYASSFYSDLYDYFNNKKVISSTIKDFVIEEHHGARTTSQTYIVILDNGNEFKVNPFTSVIDEDDIGKNIRIVYLDRSRRVVDLKILK